MPTKIKTATKPINPNLTEDAYYKIIQNQLSKRKNNEQYTAIGEEVDRFILREKLTRNLNSSKTSVKHMQSIVKKRINNIRQAKLMQKKREELLIKDIEDDEKVLELIQTKNKTIGSEPTDDELALLVAMKVFNQIQIFRVSSCPELIGDPFIVDFPSTGLLHGKDISYRQKGLEKLKDKYIQIMEKKAENQKMETLSFQNKLKTSYKMARNATSKAIGKAIGVSKRVSRSEVLDFLDRLMKDGAVSKTVCEWQTYAFRMEKDFGFPSIKEMRDPMNPQKKLSETELRHMAARAAAIGSGLFVVAIILGTGLLISILARPIDSRSLNDFEEQWFGNNNNNN